MLIGEFADLTGLTTKALRHYDEVGVLSPESVSDAGYRHYSATQLRRAVVVAALRDAGVPLAEIAEADDEAAAAAAEALARHRARVEAERAAQDAAIAAADVTITTAARRTEVHEREAPPRPFGGIVLDTATMTPDGAGRIDGAVAALTEVLSEQGCPPTGPARTWTHWRTPEALDVIVGLPLESPPELPGDVDGYPTLAGTMPGGTELVAAYPGELDESYSAFLLTTLTLFEAVMARGHTVDTSRLVTDAKNGLTELSYLLPDDA